MGLFLCLSLTFHQWATSQAAGWRLSTAQETCWNTGASVITLFPSTCSMEGNIWGAYKRKSSLSSHFLSCYHIHFRPYLYSSTHPTQWSSSCGPQSVVHTAMQLWQLHQQRTWPPCYKQGNNEQHILASPRGGGKNINFTVLTLLMLWQWI